MRPPPSILGAALLFWGWRTDFLLESVIGAVLLELSHVFNGRWNFSDKEFNRLWDVCTIIFVSCAAYLRFSEEVTSAAYKFFQLFPLVFFPMMAGLTWSSRDAVPMKAFSWFMRVKGRAGADKPVAFGWVYFAICLTSSGASNMRDIWFYTGVALLAGWALWSTRPRRISNAAWISLFLVVAAAGFAGQFKLQDLQTYLENKASDLFVRWGRKEFDPRESKTAMGRIGELKRSSEIVMKVRAEPGPVPARLRQAAYAKLEGDTWRGSGRSFESVPIEPDTTTWTLQSETNVPFGVRIIERVPKRTALLSFPAGTAQFRELTTTKVETNRYAVVKVEDNPAVLSYVARYGLVSSETPPNTSGQYSFDLNIPDEEFDAIESIAEELNIGSLPVEKQLARIHSFFQEKFKYSTYQEVSELQVRHRSPLTLFLTQTRTGHCEYFASATVLLLRYFNIPARYITGYAVQEADLEGDTWIVRQRHAHAWASAYVGGRWIEVDTTPAGWGVEDAKEEPFYQPLANFWDQLSFSFLEWRWLGDRSFFRTLAPWFLVPMIFFLGWRIFGRKMVRAVRPFARIPAGQGGDSEFYLLEKKLRRLGMERQDGETTAQWVARALHDQPLPELLEILRLHYKYRFDPEGLRPEERARLSNLVKAALARL